MRTIIFVVDSTDRERIGDAREELQKISAEGALEGVPLLVLANKQDLPDPMSAAQIQSLLGLRNLMQIKWHVQPCSAKTNQGLADGLGWLEHTVGESTETAITRRDTEHRGEH